MHHFPYGGYYGYPMMGGYGFGYPMYNMPYYYGKK
jgi:hypothetical protein